MYGGALGSASTSREGAVINETSSTIKSFLDSWYQTNFSGKDLENLIVDNLFCNDRQLSSEVGGTPTGPGYGRLDRYTTYAEYHRLYSYKNPTLKCGLKNDRFTKSDIKIGNGALTYSVGLLTADEASMVGLLLSTNNNSNYLFLESPFWLLTPFYMNDYNEINAFAVHLTGYFTYVATNNIYGVRPVISIRGDITVTGDGSNANPFKLL